MENVILEDLGNARKMKDLSIFIVLESRPGLSLIKGFDPGVLRRASKEAKVLLFEAGPGPMAAETLARRHFKLRPPFCS